MCWPPVNLDFRSRFAHVFAMNAKKVTFHRPAGSLREKIKERPKVNFFDNIRGEGHKLCLFVCFIVGKCTADW